MATSELTVEQPRRKRQVKDGRAASHLPLVPMGHAWGRHDDKWFSVTERESVGVEAFQRACMVRKSKVMYGLS